MPTQKTSARRQPGGLSALKNNPTVAGCKNPRRPFLKAVNNAKKVVYFIRPDCKLWSCPHCAERRRGLWVFVANYGADALLGEGRKISFVTLTSHELVREVYPAIRVWRSAWKKLSARWRREAPGAQYLYVGEHKKSLNFHVHLITSADIEDRWYKDNARQCGLGYEADVIAISLAIECGGYIGKYLAKSIMFGGWPPYWRRINSSRKWPRPPKTEAPLEWTYAGNNVAHVEIMAGAYARAGWLVESSVISPDIR